MPYKTDEDIKTSAFVVGKDGVFTELGKVEEIDLTPSSDSETDYDSSIMKMANDWIDHVREGFELRLGDTDICVRKLIATVIDERFGTNNWRKLHGLPMWRLK